VNKALDFLKQNEVQAILPVKNLVWDEEACVHCSACTGQCLSGALAVDRQSMKVVYEGEKCIACELCIAACPFGAVESISDHLEKTGEL
jgi:Fe-S-cluster-containing dehydrogenase component